MKQNGIQFSERMQSAELKDKKGIAILGATGSIGTQALEVMAAHRDRFDVRVLTAGNNAALLIQLAREFQPEVVVIGDETRYAEVKAALSGTEIEVQCGSSALSEVVQRASVDLVLTAVVGAVGLEPTIAAIRAGKDIALANKETLVVGGALIMRLVQEHGVRLLPVDSEHSAIFQCLEGEDLQAIEKIYLTASGGPFRGMNRSDLAHVTLEQALKHPNWTMGAKITIDSASMMNKGLEVIEAKWLFDLDLAQIDVVVHPQSIIHSMVQYRDGSVVAQMGVPDMKLPIQYALAYPDRVENSFPRLDLLDYPTLTFEQPDRQTFRNLDLAYEALRKGGNAPCVLNAANEVVVEAFLKERIGFLAMSDVIERTMEDMEWIGEADLDLEACLETDRLSRIRAAELIGVPLNMT